MSVDQVPKIARGRSVRARLRRSALNSGHRCFPILVGIQGPWSLNVDVKKVWFETDAKINDGALKSSVNLDPWVVSLGVSRKF